LPTDDEDGGEVYLSDHDLELVTRLLVARDEKRRAEQEEKEVRDELLATLKERQASRGLTAAGISAVEIQTQHRRTVSRPKLEALYPEVFKDVVEEKVVEIVRVNSW
jgi:inorganic pyrophosphatase/exopolyphosphatase